MYKIVLADDEPIIIRGLKKLIDWEKVNAEVVGEAQDGKGLLEVAERERPDIIISDIAMPGMTGLDVIRVINERKWNIKVIFLSGYQEFSYAKEAISSHAVDYLLKPAGKEELEECILRAEKLFKREDAVDYTQKDGLQEIFKNLNSEYEYTDLYNHFKELGIETSDKYFAGVCFALSHRAIQIINGGNKFELLKFAIFKRVQEYLQEQKIGFVIKRDDNRSNIIFILPKENTRTILKRTVQDTIGQIEKEYEIRLTAGIGDIIDDIRQLKYAYKTAKFASELYYFEQQEVIWYQDINREFHHSFEDDKKAYEVFFTSVLDRSPDWRERFNQCLDIIESLHFGNRYAAENRCIVLASDFYRDLTEYKLLGEEGKREYEGLMERLRRQNTYGQLKKVFTAYVENVVREIKSKGNTGDIQVIRQVKKYIGEHFAEEITLEQIAGTVYMNPYYFSTFFKKGTGQNFKSYLVEVRMKEAMKLLMEKDIKTYELAKSVGYNDVRTFTDKFKEMYGDSPTNYKKSRM